MNMTNLAYAENLTETENGVTLTKNLEIQEGIWDYLVTEMKKVFRFTRKETKWFKNCKTAKLIANIPFVASCDEPERTAIAHLCMYVAEIRGFEKYCSHLPSDDSKLFKRLDFISTFEGGDKRIIEYYMNILALIMIEGYHRTEEDDRKKGVYNPFVSGAWNYNLLKNNIIKQFGDKDFFTLKNHDIDSWN